MITGAQFFTLRDFCTDAEGIVNTLEKVKEIGYSAVQLSGIARMDVNELKNTLDRLGLEAVVTHTPYDAMINKIEEVAAAHKLLGCKYVGIGSMPGAYTKKEKADFIAFAKEFDALAKEYAKYDLKLTYHNHAFEFEKFDGKTVLEIMKENSECFTFLLDTYWMQCGGMDVCETIEKFADRIEIIHFKDMAITYEGKQIMEAVGSGNLNWNKIIKTCNNIGITHAFVEQDDCNGENPFDCMKRSYDFLKKAGLK